MVKLFGLAITISIGVCAAQPDAVLTVSKSTRRVIAIPDLRGAGEAQKLMGVFNQTLWSDIRGCGLVDLAAKTKYPLFIPQVPTDFQLPAAIPDSVRSRAGESIPTSGGGHWMADWSAPPVSATYLAFGYSAVQNGVFETLGYFYDVTRGTPQSAQLIAKRYTATSVDEAGARKAAHEFAADIIRLMGGTPIFNSHIYFISDRTGSKEMWVMDADGSNQRQLTRGHFLTLDPAVSVDGTKFACTVYPAEGQQPRVKLYSTDPVRELPFQNPAQATYVAQPSFTPDGKQMVYASSVDAGYRISIANIDGSNARALSTTDSIQLEPQVNPKNSGLIAFVSGRTGTPQIYTMNSDGVDQLRFSSGVGEAVNPAWSPDGKSLAFAWTQGYQPGSYNIFLMPLGAAQPIQLTKASGKNEHPSWALDGAHLAFQSNRSGKYQIWTMIADGSQDPAQLTTQGNNTSPVWGQ